MTTDQEIHKAAAKIFYFGVVIIVVALLSMSGCSSTNKEKELDNKKLAYTLGCFRGSQHSCVQIANDIKRGDCYENALDFCPKNADTFKDWLSKGVKSK